MEFRTLTDLPKYLPHITHQDELWVWGSCFATHIGQHLQDAKFNADINPFGVLYNPQSILTAIRQVIEGKSYTASDLFFHQEQYRSLMHHGSFAQTNAEDALEMINARIRRAHRIYPDVNKILITFGTAWVYRLKTDGRIVGNCHKLPATSFERIRLSVNEIVSTYSELIEEMLQAMPERQFIFTVSPIRHLKDGAHGNQLSKATLLLAIDQLQERFPNHVHYFPAYEIVIDELRDYRFYNEDMIHPSPLAVEYVWQQFATACFTQETQTVINSCEKIQKDLRHRPIHGQSEAYRDFLKQIVLKIDGLARKYPKLDFEKEKLQCHTLLKK